MVVGDDGFGDGLADGVDLGGVPAAVDADADVDAGKFVEADDEEGFVDLLGGVLKGVLVRMCGQGLGKCVP